MMTASETTKNMLLKRFIWLTCFALVACLPLQADDHIPQAAWKIGIGVPPPNPGGRKPALPNLIDDGYWQGAPVGGFGAGTFSRSYRGNFERWHIKAGVHKYEDVPGNQFAVFVQPEGETGRAIALSTGKPLNGALSSWNWSSPGQTWWVGSAMYRAASAGPSAIRTRTATFPKMYPALPFRASSLIASAAEPSAVNGTGSLPSPQRPALTWK